MQHNLHTKVSFLKPMSTQPNVIDIDKFLLLETVQNRN